MARLRAVIKAKDTELAALRSLVGALRAELDALAEDRRLRELRVAELERRLGQDSTNSGTPSSKEGIGARERRRAQKRKRQVSERERRTDRMRGGQPGHPGAGLTRDPDPDERKSADPPAQCSRCGAGLDGAEPAAPGWAQVWDIRFSRFVTEWALTCPSGGKISMFRDHGLMAATHDPPGGEEVGRSRLGSQRRAGPSEASICI